MITKTALVERSSAHLEVYAGCEPVLYLGGDERVVGGRLLAGAALPAEHHEEDARHQHRDQRQQDPDHQAHILGLRVLVLQVGWPKMCCVSQKCSSFM